MENLIALLGLLFFMFLVLAASVEVILEVLRGTLEFFGLKSIKGKISVEEALKLSAEFAPNNTELNTKIEAVKSAASQIKSTAEARLTELQTIADKLKTLAKDSDTSAIAGELNAIAATVKASIDTSEGRRIFVLRLIAAIIGCFLVYSADFYVFRMLATAPEAKDYLSSLEGLQAQWVNIAVGGFAAAAGSSYWHDKLDKIRNLKTAISESKKLVSNK
jgi:hypothetical protein